MSVSVLMGLTGAASFAASVLVSAFVSGVAWGSTKADIKAIERDLSEIKGMFTLTLKQ